MMKVNVLIIEDEMIVAMDIQCALEKLHFNVTDIATNYHDALESVQKNRPDILLADINLVNSKNGIETAKDIQQITQIPIIYLTAYSNEKTVYEAAKTNPIGYINKPFTISDLKTNILLAVHKINKTKSNCKNLGDGFLFNKKDMILYHNEETVKLSNKERKLLDILIKADGRLVKLETLEYLIWPEGPVSKSTLRTLLYRLRIKLNHKMIQTIPSMGCKLIINT